MVPGSILEPQSRERHRLLPNGVHPLLEALNLARAGWPVDQVPSPLVMLELKGLVRLAGGMSYSVVRESELLYNVETSRKGNPASNEPT